MLITTAAGRAELADMVERREEGLPLEQILGWAAFCGLRIGVDPGVFVPRRRTEYLVDRAAAVARPAVAGVGPAGRIRRRRLIVVDLCCGTGAVGAALAAALRRVEVYAVDIDPAAVRCARRNLTPAGGRVYHGDLYRPLPPALRGRVHLLVANAPYVPSAGVDLLPAEARMHEPRIALDGGDDGLDVLRRIVVAAPDWLAPGGHLLVETSQRQAPWLVETATEHGLIARTERSEGLDATVLIASGPTPPRGGWTARWSCGTYRDTA
jgi:release factor glutamine methyltransferase